MTTSTRRRLLLTLPLLLLAASAQAGSFEPFGQLEVRLDDKVLEDAEMFLSQQAGGYLVLSSALEQPVMLNVRNQKAERIDATKIRRSDDGTVSLAADFLLGTVGDFHVEGGEKVVVALGEGRSLTLGPKPFLIGARTAREVIEHDVSYGYRASQYPVTQATVDKLREETRDVEVKVFFGSWCPTCARFLPWILEVEKALEGSKIRFVYYGLPHVFGEDPEAKAAGVTGVPTAIVWVDGKELGRRSAQGLGIPEKALAEILGLI